MRRTHQQGGRRFCRRALLGLATAVAVGRLFAVDLLTINPVYARPLDDVLAAGSVRVAVYRDFPPYSWKEDGVVKGVDVDIAREVAKILGVKADIWELTAGETVSDDLRNGVWKGHYLGGGVADFMMRVPYDRAFGVLNPEAVLAAPYHRERFVFLRDPERVDTAVIENLPDVPLAVEIDSVPDFHLVSAAGGRLRSNVKHYMTMTLALDALWSGEAAAAAGPRTQIEAALATRPQRGFVMTPLTMPPPMRASWDVGIAVNEASRDLAYAVGDALAAMAADGRMAAIFAKYGATWEPIPIDD